MTSSSTAATSVEVDRMDKFDGCPDDTAEAMPLPGVVAVAAFVVPVIGALYFELT